jgi:hypothetical protein
MNDKQYITEIAMSDYTLEQTIDAFAKYLQSTILL